MEENGESYDYWRKRYHRRIELAKKKLGNKCHSCGATNELSLIRLDPEDKASKLSKIWSASKLKFYAALKNYQLTCLDCKLKNLRHGTVSSYNRCRCEECVAAKSKYNREYKAR